MVIKLIIYAEVLFRFLSGDVHGIKSEYFIIPTGIFNRQFKHDA